MRPSKGFLLSEAAADRREHRVRTLDASGAISRQFLTRLKRTGRLVNAALLALIVLGFSLSALSGQMEFPADVPSLVSRLPSIRLQTADQQLTGIASRLNQAAADSAQTAGAPFSRLLSQANGAARRDRQESAQTAADAIQSSVRQLDLSRRTDTGADSGEAILRQGRRLAECFLDHWDQAVSRFLDIRQAILPEAPSGTADNHDASF